MRTSTEISKQERVELKGNWMQLTIAPLVEERLEASKRDRLGSFVGTTGRTGLAHDDLAKPRK